MYIRSVVVYHDTQRSNVHIPLRNDAALTYRTFGLPISQSILWVLVSIQSSTIYLFGLFFCTLLYYSIENDLILRISLFLFLIQASVISSGKMTCSKCFNTETVKIFHRYLRLSVTSDKTQFLTNFKPCL